MDVRTIVALIFGAAALAVGGPVAAAQGMAPATQAIVAPGETVQIQRPSVRVPGTTLGISVSNESGQTAIVSDDGRVMTITLPAGFTAQAETDAPVRGADRVLPCPNEPRSPTIARCVVDEYRLGIAVRLRATQTPPATETVMLTAGCNNVTLTWPPLSPLSLIAAAVSPESALESVWRWDTRRFAGFAINAPSEANDYRQTGGRLETAFFCLRRPGTMVRPAMTQGTTAVATLRCEGPHGSLPGVATLTATLRDESGAPLVDREIRWSDRPGLSSVVAVSPRTDASGASTARYAVPWDAGTMGEEVVTATFAGDATTGGATCQVQFPVNSPPLPTPTPRP